MDDISKGDQQISVVSSEENHDAFTNICKGGLIILLVSSMSWFIVSLSEIFEKNLFSSGITSISILSCTASKVLWSLCQKNTQSKVGDVAQQLSDIWYYMLLYVIGMSMNLRRLSLDRWWSSCSSIMFATVPLIVHFVVILLGSLGSMRIFPRYKLDMEEIVAASNAAICGPITAAALIGKASRGLALAAIFWGVVGYALATNVGVAMSKSLLLKMK